ncbi:flagellar motor switch protein FliG [Parasphingorhabdus sp. JC815]|uniref:flagellar motor switch protein FliG n=1 Tax=Parasphingorhabdus sp. JC815 TaxID=3232140 RepID=UPI003459F1FA
MVESVVNEKNEPQIISTVTDVQEHHLSGRQTAAILLMIFGEDEAADILSRLLPDEVQGLGEAMFEIRNVTEEEVNLVFDRFVERARSRTTVGYRADKQIQNMFNKALGPSRAANMLSRVRPQQNCAELNQLKWMTAEEVVEMIADEHPQLMAVVLSFLDPEIAGKVLQKLDADIQDDVVFRVASMGAISANAVSDIESLLSKQVQKPGVIIGSRAGNASDAAAIMNNVEKPAEQRIIKALLKRDKSMARAIEEEMLVFSDLIALEDKSLGTLIRSVENPVLLLAIKGAESSLAKKMFACMSKRAAQSIQDELAEMGPVSKDDVIIAQKQIVALARLMAEEGTIILKGHSDDFV